MIEFFIGISFGYFIGRFASALVQPQLDRLLVWDSGIFAWRVVPQGTRLDATRKYLAATDIVLNDEHHMKRYNDKNLY